MTAVVTEGLPIAEATDVAAIDARASLLMKQGIALMQESRPGAAREALALFDRALEQRRRLPFETEPLLRYGLAACWLNRAEALTRLGAPQEIDSALEAFDQAIALLRHLPLADDSRFVRRLAIAHQNRGLAMTARDGASGPEAIAAYKTATAILDGDAAELIPDRSYLLAAVCLNLANAQASTGTVEGDAAARIAARRAIALVAGAEHQDADAAEVGLKGRHVLCKALVGSLSEPAGPHDRGLDDVHAATDAVDAALELVARWEQREVIRFRQVACDLFRFGAAVYGRFQPHFLAEFIADHQDGRRSSAAFVESAEMRAAVDEARRLIGHGIRPLDNAYH